MASTEALSKVPLLSKLTADEKKTLSGLLTTQSYETEADIIKQGDPGDGFYIIKTGTCRVHKTSGDSKDSTTIGALKDGDYFGETALLNATSRGATITATSPVVCFYISREKFVEKFGGKGKLNVQFAKRKAVSAENTEASSSYVPSVATEADKKKTDDQVNKILSAIKYNVLFMNLSKPSQHAVIDEMFQKIIPKGENAIKQGDQGDNLYVVESGEFHVFVNETRVAIRQAGTCFGELALMYNSPRAATVTAAEDSVVWVVDRFTFRRVVTNVSASTLNKYNKFLQQVDLLHPLASYEREKIAEALEEVEMAADSTIVKQGEEGECMYIVHSGTLIVTKTEGGGKPEVVANLKSGDFFGERALVKNEPRAATVTAQGEVTLLRLDRHAFAMLLGPLQDILNKKAVEYEEKKPTSSRTESKSVSGDEERIEFSSLQVLGTLGKGSFGHVQLVKAKGTGTTYALKAVSKAQIVQTGQQGHIMSEKRAMAALRHPFLIRLFCTYKDQDRLYFLLEPSLGGELFSVLREKTLFDEDTSRFYGAHVVMAFEYMHSLNYVYRDLKPENLLLDAEGYIKVTDFGFAKDISGGRTWTLCGTPDYLAPEIVAGKGHGKGVDWWTLGVFIYEMLASYPPFYDEDPMKTYAKIMQGSITFPSHFSKEAVSIVKKLLYHKSTKRLGVVKGGASMIKKHAWYKNFSFDALLKRELKAPFIPTIKSDTDISNFDDYGDESDDIESYEDDGTNWDADF